MAKYSSTEGSSYSWRATTTKNWAGEFIHPDCYHLTDARGNAIASILKHPYEGYRWTLNHGPDGCFFYKEGKAETVEAAKAAMAQYIPALKDAKSFEPSRSARPIEEMPSPIRRG
jgi:hypothetical protein